MPPTTVWSLFRMTTARGRLWLGPALLSLYSTNGATINFRTSSSATSVSVRVYSIGDVVVPTTAAPTVRWAENHGTRPTSRHPIPVRDDARRAAFVTSLEVCEDAIPVRQGNARRLRERRFLAACAMSKCGQRAADQPARPMSHPLR